MSMSKQTHYQILQIVSTADDVTIKRAYCKVALTNHPDKTVHLSPAERANAEEIFELANEAYKVLNNATKRSAYDRNLRTIWASSTPSRPPRPRPFKPAPTRNPFMNRPKPRAAPQPPPSPPPPPPRIHPFTAGNRLCTFGKRASDP
jgi:curved DNA-binding protein CbpA